MESFFQFLDSGLIELGILVVTATAVVVVVLKQKGRGTFFGRLQIRCKRARHTVDGVKHVASTWQRPQVRIGLNRRYRSTKRQAGDHFTPSVIVTKSEGSKQPKSF
jgi:hypothetical protein